MDAFVRVGPLIGQREAELLRAAMVTVFSAIERGADPDEVVGFTRPNPTGYSDWLREGLATTLLLFAVWSDPAEVNLAGETGQAFANRVLNELPGLRTDPRLLTSLRNELPLLAEAGPAGGRPAKHPARRSNRQTVNHLLVVSDVGSKPTEREPPESATAHSSGAA